MATNPNPTNAESAESANGFSFHLFEAALSSIRDFVYLFDRSGRFLYANRPLLQLLQLTQAEIIGKNFFDLNYPPELAARLQKQIELVFQTKTVVTDETPFTGPSGMNGVYEYIFTPVFGPDGLVNVVAGSTRDITERKRAQAVQMNFRQLFESVPGRYLVLEPDGDTIVAVSDTYLQATLTNRDAIMNRSVFEAFPYNPHSKADVTVPLRASLERVKIAKRTDVMAAQYYPVPNPNGDGWEERWWSPINSPIFGENGQIMYIIHRVEDVSAFILQKRGEGREEAAFAELESRSKHIEADIVLRGQELQNVSGQLRQSEEKYRMLFNSIDDGFCIVQVLFDENNRAFDYRFLETNPAFEKQTGIQNAQNKRMREIAPAHENWWYDVLGRVAQNGQPVRSEYHADALDRWFDFYAVRVGTPGENKVATVFRDTTERKRAEQNADFLASVTADLPKRITVAEIMETVGAKIGAYLKLSTCAFFEIDEARDEAVVTHDWHKNDIPSLVGTYRIGEFVTGEFYEACRAGKTFVVRDVVADERTDAINYASIGVGAYVSVPIVRNGKWRFLLVMFDCTSRNWRPDEVELTGELTSRIWARLERTRAEQALRESEERLRIAIEAAKMGTWDWDVTTDTVVWSDRLFTFFGMNPGEPEAFFAHVHPGDFDRVRGLLEKSIREKIPYQDEFRIIANDGTTRWMSNHGQIVDGGASGITRMSGVLFDITERKRAEEVLREAEARLRELANAVPHQMWMSQPEGGVLYYNQRFYDYTGLPPDEAQSMGWQTIIHPDDLAGTLSSRKASLEQGEPWIHEYRLRRADGQFRWHRGHVLPIRDKNGIVRWVGTATDMDEETRAAQALQNSEKQLRRANEELEVRVAERTKELLQMGNLRQELLRRLVTAQEEERRVISRDLHDDTGQQVIGLLLGLRNLKSLPAVVLSPDAQELLTRIEAIAGEIAQKSHRIAFTLRPTALDDAGLVAALRNYFEEWSRWSGLPVEFASIGLDTVRLLPEVETTIYRVVQEALTNILRHAAIKNGATGVNIVLQRTAHTVSVVVEDDGPGFVVEATLNPALNAGRLGLFGMQERATLLGGVVTIESEPGRGTTVFLRIPLSTTSTSAIASPLSA